MFKRFEINNKEVIAKNRFSAIVGSVMNKHKVKAEVVDFGDSDADVSSQLTFIVRKEVKYFNFPMRESVQGWRQKWFYLRDRPVTGHRSNLPPFEDVLEAVPKKSWQNTLTAEESKVADKLYEKILELKSAGGQTMCGT
jgi:hypothetical protein